MYKEFVQVKAVDEVKAILLKHSDDFYFTDNELKSVEPKNTVKSFGARYLIKKSILDYLKMNEEYHDIEIKNNREGKPFVSFKGKVKEKINEQKNQNIQVSISHSRNFISTLVIVE